MLLRRCKVEVDRVKDEDEGIILKTQDFQEESTGEIWTTRVVVCVDPSSLNLNGILNLRTQNRGQK